MKWSTIRPLVVKDLRLYFRNRFYAFISVIGLVGFVGLYLLLPRTVDEIIELGLYAPSGFDALKAVADEEGLAFLQVDSEESLRQAVTAGDLVAGIALPEGFLEQLSRGVAPVVNIFISSSAMEGTSEMVEVLVESLALTLTGHPLSVEVQQETLGRDLGGAQVPPRDRMLPLLALMALVTETMGLSSVIAEEIQSGTLRALLVTPMGVPEFFAGKAAVGVGMTFVQAALVMALTGGLRHQPLIILVTLLLGALLVTGLGFWMASACRDMLSVMGLGVLAMVVLGIPAFGVVFPGTVSTWARVIPSYYLVETLHQVANLGFGWAPVWQNLLVLLGADAVLFVGGAATLRRRFA